MSKAAEAAGLFAEGWACAQAVLAVCSREEGLDADLANRVSCGFGAGMGRTCQTCGAVAGAYMVLGLKYGRDKLEAVDARSQTCNLVRKFNRLFVEENSSVNCQQ